MGCVFEPQTKVAQDPATLHATVDSDDVVILTDSQQACDV